MMIVIFYSAKSWNYILQGFPQNYKKNNQLNIKMKKAKENIEVIINRIEKISF